ncbi:RNA methyltransferase [Opitutaceae bacterium EW11]|nr:RNA methyltransferase [Opitutaceae bacterium EW11]
MKPKEIPVCGLAAVQALFARDPAAIKRLYFDYPTSRKLAKLSSHLAKTKRIYRVVTPSELEKVGGTVHHGGVVAVIEAQPLLSPAPGDVARWTANRAPLLILDRIGNAHNLGAIARTAAFFGIEDLLLRDHPQQALPGEAAYRVAEGGLEHLHVWSVPELPEFCLQLRKTYDVIGAAVGPTSRPLGEWQASRGRAHGPAKPIALVLGNEEQGLSPEVAQACTAQILIPGKGNRVESLNVSVAAAVFMWELWARLK